MADAAPAFVERAEAESFGEFQQVAMFFAQGQALSRKCGGLDHEAHVLQVLRKPGLRLEVASDHLVALRIHDPRVTHAVPQHGERLFRVKPQLSGEGQPFSQHRPVQAQNQIAHQFQLGGAAPIPNVMNLARETREQIVALRDPFRGSAHDNQDYAPADLAAAPGNRALDISHPVSGLSVTHRDGNFRAETVRGPSLRDVTASLSDSGLGVASRIPICNCHRHPVPADGPMGCPAVRRCRLVRHHACDSFQAMRVDVWTSVFIADETRQRGRS